MSNRKPEASHDLGTLADEAVVRVEYGRKCLAIVLERVKAAAELKASGAAEQSVSNLAPSVEVEQETRPQLRLPFEQSGFYSYHNCKRENREEPMVGLWRRRVILPIIINL